MISGNAKSDATATPNRRRYDSTHRVARAHETREEIARAARRLFLDQGWGATTMRAVAREASVSMPTVYASYGNRAGLVWALIETADLTADGPTLAAELIAAADDPARQLAAMAAYDRRLFERAGDIIGLIRDAGRTEPELATLYRELRQRADEARTRVFSSWPPEVLRAGIDLAAALDIYAALCNIDVYTTLTDERGWPPERAERWWSEALSRELLRS